MKYVDAGQYYEQSQLFGGEVFGHHGKYNQACILYREGKLEESLEAFKKLLDEYPDDEDIKYNVEFIEQKMKEMLIILIQHLHLTEQVMYLLLSFLVHYTLLKVFI